MDLNNIYNIDCMVGMKEMEKNSVNLTLTDIPYGEVNRATNGLRELDKGYADELNFKLEDFLEELYRVTSNTIIIFCGKKQFSTIFSFFCDKKGTTRALVWEKSNPSPMNGQYIYLSGIEMAVWFKKSGAKTFNARCKNTVFKFAAGSSKIHKTEKNHKLLEDLILDNSNEEEIVFDPCCGSGSTLLVSKKLNRKYLGFELNEEMSIKAKERL